MSLKVPLKFHKIWNIFSLPWSIDSSFTPSSSATNLAPTKPVQWSGYITSCCPAWYPTGSMDQYWSHLNMHRDGIYTSIVITMFLASSSGNVTSLIITVPDSKVYGANMGPIWGRQDPGGPHVGPMNFAIWGDAHENHGISNHQQLDCLFSSLTRLTTRTSKLGTTVLCEGNPMLTSGFLSQMATWKTLPQYDIIML